MALIKFIILLDFWVKSVSYNLNIAFIGYRKIHLGKIFSSWLSALRLNRSFIYYEWVGDTVSKL